MATLPDDFVYEVEGCFTHLARRIQLHPQFTSWIHYCTPEQLLPGEFGKVGTVRLVRLTDPAPTPEEHVHD